MLRASRADVEAEPPGRFIVMACIELDAPIGGLEGEDSGRLLAGYFRDFGVTAASEAEARMFVTGAVTDGRISWSHSTISSVVPDRLHPAIIARSLDWTTKGIWYAGGRIFFPRD